MTKAVSSLARTTVALLILSSLWLSSPPARADQSADDAVAQVTQLNKDAIAAYQAKKYDDARKLLKQALELSASAGLDQHPITARTHIHMGIVIIVGFNQRDVGIKQFKKAIEIEPEINLTKTLVTPDLKEAFAEAKGAGGDGSPAAPATPTAPPPPAETPPTPETPPAKSDEAAAVSGTGLVHEAVTQGNQGSTISITVGVAPDLEFDKIVLAYRPEGANDFLGREMKQVAEGRYGAEIPTTATLGTTVAYYVEADDKEGNPVAERGSADSPLIIRLTGARTAVRKRPASEDESSKDEEDDEGPDNRFFVALMAGTGFGWATGNGDTNADTMISPAGMALAGVGQVSPEVGYWVGSSLMLSVQLRYQYITGPTDVFSGGKDFHTANYALAAFAKATWRWGDDSFHPFFSLAAGGGNIRHVVSFSHQGLNNCGAKMNETCIDTIAAGPVLVGPGAGLMYDLGDHFGLIAEADTALGFPNFTFNVDVNVGVAVGF